MGHNYAFVGGKLYPVLTMEIYVLLLETQVRRDCFNVQELNHLLSMLKKSARAVMIPKHCISYLPPLYHGASKPLNINGTPHYV